MDNHLFLLLSLIDAWQSMSLRGSRIDWERLLWEALFDLSQNLISFLHCEFDDHIIAEKPQFEAISYFSISFSITELDEEIPPCPPLLRLSGTLGNPHRD